MTPRNQDVHPALNALLKDRMFIETIVRLISVDKKTVRLTFMTNDFDFFEFDIAESGPRTLVELKGFTNAGTSYKKSFIVNGTKRISNLERKLKMIFENKNTKASLVRFALLQTHGNSRIFNYMPTFQRLIMSRVVNSR
jgi:hypothetical protein